MTPAKGPLASTPYASGPLVFSIKCLQHDAQHRYTWHIKSMQLCNNCAKLDPSTFDSFNHENKDLSHQCISQHLPLCKKNSPDWFPDNWFWMKRSQPDQRETLESHTFRAISPQWETWQFKEWAEKCICFSVCMCYGLCAFTASTVRD